MINLISKMAFILRTEGPISLLRKVLHRLFHKREVTRLFKDILFINGCALPHPSRYRVTHQIEQLHFNGYSCDQLFYEDLDLSDVKYYRAFVFFRCPYTDTVGEFIEKAKLFNKKTFFDIDDLVIDKKYVDKIEYVRNMNGSEYKLYMDGVQRMQKTMLLCDYGITTTTRLQSELLNYLPDVFVNRNVASEEMVNLSLATLVDGDGTHRKRKVKNTQNNSLVLGYFSGSITHNEDFELIIPVLVKILNEFPNVSLKVVGYLDLPANLVPFKDRIVQVPFVDWKKLPGLIHSVDINLVPLKDTIFNQSKSENKWVEASLVKVPTVASNVGPFGELINNGVTGILCRTSSDWLGGLKLLITDKNLRRKIGNDAHRYVIKNNVTAYTGFPLFRFIDTKLNRNFGFFLPSTEVSGGVGVATKHADILQKKGYDVTLFSFGDSDKNIIGSDSELNVISLQKANIHATIDTCIATLWTTVSYIYNYPKCRKKLYLVQGFETDFNKFGNSSRIFANLTYNLKDYIGYITISKWCQSWLQKHFDAPAKFAPNGINLSSFKYRKRKFKDKIKILIEGNSVDANKNVDESFKIVRGLSPDKYEIWYLSNSGEPKKWYRYDKFLYKIPNNEVGEKAFSQCDILLKSSILESFSYPPLEMMATGGVSVVARNDGNVEYLRNNENCLMYETGDIDTARKLIETVVVDNKLREKLVQNGLTTAKSRSWDSIIDEIVSLYE